MITLKQALETDLLSGFPSSNAIVITQILPPQGAQLCLQTKSSSYRFFLEHISLTSGLHNPQVGPQIHRKGWNFWQSWVRPADDGYVPVGKYHSGPERLTGGGFLYWIKGAAQRRTVAQSFLILWSDHR